MPFERIQFRLTATPPLRRLCILLRAGLVQGVHDMSYHPAQSPGTREIPFQDFRLKGLVKIRNGFVQR